MSYHILPDADSNIDEIAKESSLRLVVNILFCIENFNI